MGTADGRGDSRVSPIYKSCVPRIYPRAPWFTDTRHCVGGYSRFVEIPGYWDWWDSGTVGQWDSGTVGHTILHTGILHYEWVWYIPPPIVPGCCILSPGWSLHTEDEGSRGNGINSSS